MTRQTTLSLFSWSSPARESNRRGCPARPLAREYSRAAKRDRAVRGPSLGERPGNAFDNRSLTREADVEPSAVSMGVLTALTSAWLAACDHHSSAPLSPSSALTSVQITNWERLRGCSPWVDLHSAERQGLVWGRHDQGCHDRCGMGFVGPVRDHRRGRRGGRPRGRPCDDYRGVSRRDRIKQLPCDTFRHSSWPGPLAADHHRGGDHRPVGRVQHRRGVSRLFVQLDPGDRANGSSISFDST